MTSTRSAPEPGWEISSTTARSRPNPDRRKRPSASASTASIRAKPVLVLEPMLERLRSLRIGPVERLAIRRLACSTGRSGGCVAPRAGRPCSIEDLPLDGDIVARQAELDPIEGLGAAIRLRAREAGRDADRAITLRPWRRGRRSGGGSSPFSPEARRGDVEPESALGIGAGPRQEASDTLGVV